MKKVIFVLAIGVLGLASCKKGCTDSDADNYSSGAKKDDGTCTYTCTAVCYYTQNTYLSYLLPNGYNTELEFYVDGTYYSTNQADNSYTGSGTPDCSIGTLTVLEINLAGQKNKLVTVTVKDKDTGTTVFTKEQVLNGNACNAVLLEQ